MAQGGRHLFGTRSAADQIRGLLSAAGLDGGGYQSRGLRGQAERQLQSLFQRVFPHGMSSSMARGAQSVPLPLPWRALQHRRDQRRRPATQAAAPVRTPYRRHDALRPESIHRVDLMSRLAAAYNWLDERTAI